MSGLADEVQGVFDADQKSAESFAKVANYLIAVPPPAACRALIMPFCSNLAIA
jgi:hypothetical protein